MSLNNEANSPLSDQNFSICSVFPQLFSVKKLATVSFPQFSVVVFLNPQIIAYFSKPMRKPQATCETHRAAPYGCF